MFTERPTVTIIMHKYSLVLPPKVPGPEGDGPPVPSLVAPTPDVDPHSRHVLPPTSTLVAHTTGPVLDRKVNVNLLFLIILCCYSLVLPSHFDIFTYLCSPPPLAPQTVQETRLPDISFPHQHQLDLPVPPRLLQHPPQVPHQLSTPVTTSSHSSEWLT